MRIFYLLSVLLILEAFSSCCKQPEKLTEQEVLDIINRFDEGWRHKNAKAVDSVLSKQYLYFTQSGHTFDRASLVQTASSSVYQLQTMERQQYAIQLEGNTAVVNTVWKGKGSYHGQVFDDNQRCSITVVKTSGEVKILAEHCTPIKESL
ncbi:MAG: nuclear transport factor 2 family protein [Sphingobacteriales bacterium]|nr:nuclear transport factor 2 family protein [Sphingobacteriales bacterium]